MDNLFVQLSIQEDFMAESKVTRLVYKGEISKTDTITIPKEAAGPTRRPGTKVAKIYSMYRDGMTVETFLKAVKPMGGGISNLRKDLAYGRVELQKAA